MGVWAERSGVYRNFRHAAACAISRAPDPSIMLNHASWRLLCWKKFKLRLLQMNGSTLTHTLARTHSQHSLARIHSHTRKWHAFISLHDNCERTQIRTDPSSKSLPLASRVPSPAPPCTFPFTSPSWFALQLVSFFFCAEIFGKCLCRARFLCEYIRQRDEEVPDVPGENTNCGRPWHIANIYWARFLKYEHFSGAKARQAEELSFPLSRSPSLDLAALQVTQAISRDLRACPVEGWHTHIHIGSTWKASKRPRGSQEEVSMNYLLIKWVREVSMTHRTNKGHGPEYVLKSFSVSKRKEVEANRKASDLTEK